MATSKQQQSMILKLKKQASALKRREKIAKTKLHATMLKVQKMAKVYEHKLVRNAQETRTRIVEAEAAILDRLSKLLERKAVMLKKKKKAVSKLEAINDKRVSGAKRLGKKK